MTTSVQASFLGSGSKALELKSDQNWGQSFVVGSAGQGKVAIDTLKLGLYKDRDAPSQNLTVMIRSSWSGAVLWSGTIASSSLATSSGSEHTFPAITGLTLEAGVTYVLRVSSSSKDGKVYLQSSESSSAYGRGSLIDKDAKSLSGDLRFIVAGTLPASPAVAGPAPTPTPEVVPASQPIVSATSPSPIPTPTPASPPASTPAPAPVPEISFQLSGTATVAEEIDVLIVGPEPAVKPTYTWQTSSDGSTWSTVGVGESYVPLPADRGRQLRLVIDTIDAAQITRRQFLSAGSVAAASAGSELSVQTASLQAPAPLTTTTSTSSTGFKTTNFSIGNFAGSKPYEVKSDQSWGQSFQIGEDAGTARVKSIGVGLHREADPGNQTITVSVRSSWDGPALWQGSVNASQLGTAAGATYVFTGIANLVLQQGQQYLLRITSSSTNGKIFVSAADGAEGNFAGGAILQKEGKEEGSDLKFGISGTLNTPISSSDLLAINGGLVGLGPISNVTAPSNLTPDGELGSAVVRTATRAAIESAAASDSFIVMNLSFAGQNLAALDIGDAYIRNVDFSRANLSGSRWGDINNAIPDNLPLPEEASADFDLSTYLLNANWGLSFRGATLSSVDFTDIYMSGTDFSSLPDRVTRLDGAKLDDSHFAYSNFSLASAVGTSFEGADLRDAILNGADLRFASFKGADLSGARMVGALLTGASVTEATLNGTDLSDANLSGADFGKADFSGVILRGANLKGAKFLEVSFAGADLTGADLTGADLSKADFTGAILGTGTQRAILTNTIQVDTVGIASASMVGSSDPWAAFLNPAASDLGEARFVIGGDPILGNTLIAKQLASDPEGDGEFLYLWQISANNTTWTTVALTDFYVPKPSDAGQYLRLTISYKDGGGANELAKTPALKVLSASAPASLSFQIAGINAVGEEIEVLILGLEPAIEPTFLWQTSSNGTTWTSVGIGDAYAPLPPDSGKQLRVVASFFDGSFNQVQRILNAGLVSAFGTEPLDTLNPVEMGVVNNGDASFAIEGTPSVGPTLSAVLTKADYDGNPTTFNYSWESSTNKTTWTAAPYNAGTSSYTTGTGDEGRFLRLRVGYTDNEGHSANITTEPVFIPATNDNSAVVTIAGLTAGKATVGSTLTPNILTEDPDLGIDNTSLTYQWQISSQGNNSWTTVSSNQSFLVRAIDEGKLIKLVTAYKDLQGFAEVVTTDSAIAPLVDDGDATITLAGKAAVGNTINATSSVNDPDGNGNFAYNWQTSADALTWSNVGSDSPSYQVVSTDQGKQLRLLVSYTDSQGFDETVSISAGKIPLLPPKISSVGLSGSSVVLTFSKPISASSVPASAFLVESVSGAAAAEPLTINSITATNKSQLVLELASAPAQGTNVRVSYTDPIGNQPNGVIQTTTGRDAASFKNIFATNYTSSLTVSNLASQQRNLSLTGESPINGKGNAADNQIRGNSQANTLAGLAGSDVIIGNSGNDTLIGGLGSDTLTGGPGRDIFRFNLADSLLANYDRITDLVIKSDSIDGPTAVTVNSFMELGTVSGLNLTSIQEVLTTTTFPATKAASFSYNDSALGQRTFLALNDAVDGFNSFTDAIIEITGFLGRLDDIKII